MSKSCMLVAALGCLACGSKVIVNENNTGDGNTTTTQTKTIVTLSGSVEAFPIGSAPTDYSLLELAVFDPTALELSGPSATPLGEMAVPSPCDPNTGCPYSLGSVDLTNVSLGLIAGVFDTRPAGSTTFVNTFSGIATAAAITDVQQNKLTLLGAEPGFVLTNEAYALVASITGLDPNVLMTRGVLMGWVLGKLSEAVNGEIPPVAGATVAVAGHPEVQIWYPKADFSAANPAQTTSANGLFIASPSSGAQVIGQWQVTASDGVHTYQPTLAGSNPGTFLILSFVADS